MGGGGGAAKEKPSVRRVWIVSETAQCDKIVLLLETFRWRWETKYHSKVILLM